MAEKIGSNYQTFIAPLLRVKKINYKINSNQNFDIVIFTSKNGLRFFKKNLLKKNQIICTIGIGTRDYANKLGIKKVLNFDGDLESLKEKIVPYLKKNMKILHPTSICENQNLLKFFKLKGCAYFHLGCYESKKINEDILVFQNFMKHCEDGIITIFSGKTAQSFKNEIRKFSFENLCANKFLFSLSESIQNELDDFNFKGFFVANKPNELSLLNEIENFELR